MQERRRRSAAGGIAGEDHLGLGQVLGREFERRGVGRHHSDDLGLAAVRAHRSISPNTMSIEPMIAGTSASVWPLLMKSSASRWT